MNLHVKDILRSVPSTLKLLYVFLSQQILISGNAHCVWSLHLVSENPDKVHSQIPHKDDLVAFARPTKHLDHCPVEC